jgi:hypothetical protein
MGDQVRGPADYLELGTWNARCSMCGKKEKANRMVRNWQGLYRCKECNEPRNAQDFVRGVQDIQAPAWVQPEEDIDEFVCTYNGCSAIAGWAVPGCSVPGRSATQPVWGLFAFNFTVNAAGQSSAISTQPIPFLIGTYKTTFDDSESRNVTYTGVAMTWAPPLAHTPGLLIRSCYVNIGTY